MLMDQPTTFSDIEKRILAAMRRRPSHPWTVEELADIVYADRDPPENWRNSVKAIMRFLTNKTIPERQMVVRVAGGRGRGKKSMWSMRMN